MSKIRGFVLVEEFTEGQVLVCIIISTLRADLEEELVAPATEIDDYAIPNYEADSSRGQPDSPIFWGGRLDDGDRVLQNVIRLAPAVFVVKASAENVSHSLWLAEPLGQEGSTVVRDSLKKCRRLELDV